MLSPSMLMLGYEYERFKKKIEKFTSSIILEFLVMTTFKNKILPHLYLQT
jgi:hypothetical protein